MEVSLKEFLDAVEVIEKYKLQTLEFKSLILNNNKTKVNDWLKTNFGISVRLHNCLKYHQEKFNYDIYIEDFNKQSFLKMRYAGIKSWWEFCKLTNRVF